LSGETKSEGTTGWKAKGKLRRQKGKEGGEYSKRKPPFTGEEKKAGTQLHDSGSGREDDSSRPNVVGKESICPAELKGEKNESGGKELNASPGLNRGKKERVSLVWERLPRGGLIWKNLGANVGGGLVINISNLSSTKGRESAAL